MWNRDNSESEAASQLVNKQEIDQIVSEVQSVETDAKVFQVTDPATYLLAAECIKNTKLGWLEAEAARKMEVAPIDAQRKEVQAKYKAVLDPCDRTIETLKGKLLEYRTKVDAAMREAQDKAAELIASGDSAEGRRLLEQAASMLVEAQGINPKTLWRFRVTDLAAVDRKFLMLDEKKVQAIVSATKKECALAGIEAYPETILEVRLGDEEVGHG